MTINKNFFTHVNYFESGNQITSIKYNSNKVAKNANNNPRKNIVFFLSSIILHTKQTSESNKTRRKKNARQQKWREILSGLLEWFRLVFFISISFLISSCHYYFYLAVREHIRNDRTQTRHIFFVSVYHWHFLIVLNGRRSKFSMGLYLYMLKCMYEWCENRQQPNDRKYLAPSYMHTTTDVNTAMTIVPTHVFAQAFVLALRHSKPQTYDLCVLNSFLFLFLDLIKCCCCCQKLKQQQNNQKAEIPWTKMCDTISLHFAADHPNSSVFVLNFNSVFFAKRSLCIVVCYLLCQ